jgi:ubiquitin-like domain-containing CTD phosphatase 1
LNVLTPLLEMDLPDVVNDLDIDFASNPEAAARVQNDRRNLRKIKEVVASTTVNIMNPLREGKNLLVLDLDYSKHHPVFPPKLTVC